MCERMLITSSHPPVTPSLYSPDDPVEEEEEEERKKKTQPSVPWVPLKAPGLGATVLSQGSPSQPALSPLHSDQRDDEH